MVLSGCGTERTANAGNVTIKVGDASVSDAVLAATARSVGALGPIGDVIGVEIVTPSPDALQRSGAKDGVWLSLTSSAHDYQSEERARWIAGIIIAEVWKARHEQGDDSIVGGSLADMSSDTTADGSGMSLTLTHDLQRIMFTSEDGVTPSKFIVTDETAYRASIDAAAKSANLSVEDIRYTTSAGTVVQISETAADPKAFLARFGRTNPGLTLDPNDVEGVILVVSDSAGNIVMTSAWSTGSQTGEGGPGPTYGAAASGGASPDPEG